MSWFKSLKKKQTEKPSQSTSQKGTVDIYASPEALMHRDRDEELKCPKCGRVISDSTPRTAIVVCPCGVFWTIKNYQISTD